MSEPSCPLPDEAGAEESAIIQRLLALRRVAIVGASDDPARASFAIASYLVGHGYEVIPVNPNHQRALGLRCYPSLEAVPGEVELVNVFRRPEFCEDIAQQAVARGARGLWLQSGIASPGARRLAGAAGIPYIQDRCIMVEHMRRNAG
jgi:predicted CoA-binding protein